MPLPSALAGVRRALALCLLPFALAACGSPIPPAPTPSPLPPATQTPNSNPNSNPFSVWVANLNGQLFRIDPASNQIIATVEVSFSPGLVAVEEGAVWATGSRVSAGDTTAGALSRIDPATQQVTATLLLDTAPNDLVNCVAAGGGSVWAASPVLDEAGNIVGGKLFRVDPATGQVVAVIPVEGNPRSLAAGAGAVWVALGSGAVVRIDPATNQINATVLPGEGSFPEDLAVGAGAIWVADTAQVLRIEGTIWVAATTDAGGIVARIDPASNQVVATVPINGGANDLAISP